MREFSYKKLENSRRWRKLRQEQLNKKFEMFEKKYETHKKRIELDMYKLVEVRSRARSWGNTLHRRLEKIEESLKLQQSVISKITAKNKFRAIDM
jgi:TolB-like protein